MKKETLAGIIFFGTLIVFAAIELGTYHLIIQFIGCSTLLAVCWKILKWDDRTEEEPEQMEDE
jgi:hypothetical protein